MKPGDVLRGKYELVESIGRGGMGEVFHAVHLESGANVAIKVVSRAFLGDILMARLEREASAATRIQSEFVPRALEVDRTEDGELFLVMELLHGESLSERMKRSGGVLPWEEVRLIGDHVLQALIAAHAAGVVHRDLKPANIFIETMPAELGSDRRVPVRARILDFGVCKIDGQVEGEKLTVTGESVGTIAYMAPEQIRGASRVDERADIYSFAMVIFELVCGRLAYDAAGQMALLASKLEKSARPLATCAKTSIPAGLDAIIDRALARDPAQRCGKASEVLAAWRDLGPVISPSSSLPIVTHAGVTLNPTRTVTTGTQVPPAKVNRGALLVAGSVLAGCLLVGAAAMRHRIAGVATADVEPTASEVVAAAPAVPPSPVADPVASPVATEGAADATALPEAKSTDEPVLELGPSEGASPATSPRSPARHVNVARPASSPHKSSSEPSLIEQPHY